MDYSKHISTKKTPQTQPIFGRTDQVQNSAGGYVFKVSDQQLLERFLLIGSCGGTFYASEQKLTVKNAETIIELIKNDGIRVLQTVKEFSKKAPKKDPAIFTLALATTYGTPEVKKAAYQLITEICKTSTHLFTFCENINNLRGWSKGLCKGVSNFYFNRTADQLAYQLVKYRQRNGWTHRDVIRLAHPKDAPHKTNKLLKYAVGKANAEETGKDLLIAFERAQTNTSPKDLAALILKHSLTWEMIPTNKLNAPEVLEALLEDMPLTATLRNLNRLTKAGLFDSNLSSATTKVSEKLTNLDIIKKAGVHPVNVLNTLKTYSSGQGQKGSLTWAPNQKIVDALEECFELSFQTVEPTSKKLLVAVDVSGSMSTGVGGFQLTAKEVAAALSLTLVKSEPNIDLIWFDTKGYKPDAGKRSSYEEVLRNTPNGGGTDCSIPYSYALQSKEIYDAIVMLTDNETWAGKDHVVQLKNRYDKINPNCKHIVVGMTATEYSVLTDKDPNVLHCAGFDNSIPQLISNFIKD